MKKIVVMGCGGAGKSTLCHKLSEILDLPVYHLDQLYWQRGWVPVSPDQWIRQIKDLVCKEKWIIDGNYGSTLDLRLQDADTIVYLNMPTYLCTHQLIKRRLIYHGKSRPIVGKNWI